jgi:hypothetical protein
MQDFLILLSFVPFPPTRFKGCFLV